MPRLRIVVALVLIVSLTKRGKGTKWMVLVDGAGTPLGPFTVPGDDRL